MKDRFFIALSIVVMVCAVSFAIFANTASCDTLKATLPFANAPNRCIEQPKSEQPAVKPTSEYQPPALVQGSEIEAKLNQYRQSQGLAPLEDSLTLDMAAQERAEGMCRDNNWSHNGDWAVLGQYYTYSKAGENLYYGSLIEKQADDAVTSWVASPEHHENIVGSYTQFGIGVKKCPGFQGSANAVIVTNYFGVPQ